MIPRLSQVNALTARMNMKQTEIIKDISRYNKPQLKSRANKIIKVIKDCQEWTSDKFVKRRLPDIVFWRKELNKISERLKNLESKEVK